MFHLLHMLHSREWKSWSRRKKLVAIGILVVVIVAMGLMPDMIAVFAGLLDVSLLDVLITLLGFQLILYSEQIIALATLTYGSAARRARSLANRRKKMNN